MITLVFLLSLASVMVAIGIKHDEMILVGIGSAFGLAVAYQYGRFTATRYFHNWLQHRKKEANDD